MTVTLAQAFNNGTARTNKGAVTNRSSLNKNLDLFNIIASSRGRDMTGPFTEAMKEDPEMALRMLQWVRDCRGGAGEREMFRSLLRHLVKFPEYHEFAIRVLFKVPALGYWKDLVNLYDVTEFRPYINEMVFVALAADDGLCAKYMPRKGQVASALARAAGLTAKQWRKYLVERSSTVETLMCAKKWDEIDFSKIPSLAASRYQKAFMRNAEQSYTAYTDALVAGDAKVNASVLFPYDIMKSVYSGGNETVNMAQWKALPNYMEGTNERILPMIDVSGSMTCPTEIAGLRCMDVAISLGMYLSERQEGPFKNNFLTFETVPHMDIIKGNTLANRFDNIRRAGWGGSTDIQAAFKTLLNSAKRYKVSQEQMPTMMVILSDMEFDCSWISGRSVSAFEMIDAEYKAAGYERPKLVFWNLNGRIGNNPVTITDGGTCSVSGFSPSVMKSILSAADFDPYSIMRDTLMVEKYDL